MTTLKVRLCDCGGTPRVRCARVAEDAEEAWLECRKCGVRSEPLEDAYCAYEAAADMWNRRQMDPLAPQAPTKAEGVEG